TSACPYRPKWTDGRCWDDSSGHGGGPVIERSQQGGRFGDPAVHQLDEQKGGLSVGARETVADGLRRAVGEEDATVIPEERVAQGRLHADARRPTGEDQGTDAKLLQRLMQFGVVKGAVARLDDDRLARPRCEFGQDVVVLDAGCELARIAIRG